MLHLPTRETVEWRSIIVRPELSEISAFCTELTGHTQEGIAAGIPFAEACLVLERDFEAGRRVWASWGDYDRKQIQNQCEAAGIAYPLSQRHTNAKKVFAREFRLKQAPGMAKALSLSGLELIGRHHSGVDDAYNISRLIALLVERGSWPHS